MQEKIKSLDEVSKEIEEKIGEIKRFSPNNGYYNVTFRSRKEFERVDSKIRKELTFIGKKYPFSFGLFKSKKGYNSKYNNTKEYANHYGEYIAYIILKQLGKKVCNVDLGEISITHPYSHKDIIVQGILSHYHLSQEDIFRPISSIAERYKNKMKKELDNSKEFRKMFPKGKTNSDKNYTNVEVILKSLESFYKENGQEEKIPEARKKFFDMCMFDLKFANRDRHDDNFGLKISQRTNNISFYNLFDNEQILGMQEEIGSIKTYLKDEVEYKRFKNRELTSCIGIPGKTQKIPATELLQYLLENYYDETMDSYKDISRYKKENLEEVLQIFPDLSKEHKKFALKIFEERTKEMENVIQNYTKKRTNEEISL